MSADQEGTTAIQVGRIGLAGAIIGAIIGGLGSFSGTYFTLKDQHDTQSSEARRAAYVSLLTKTQQYRELLINLGDDAARNDQAAYTKDRERLASAGPALTTAYVAIALISSKELKDKSAAMAGAYVSHPYVPQSLDQYGRIADAVLKAIDRGQKAYDEFIDEARTDVLKE